MPSISVQVFRQLVDRWRAGWAICHWLSEIPGLGYIHYQFPIAFLLCYALFVAVSAFAVQHWQTHRLAEKSIVEQLREIA